MRSVIVPVMLVAGERQMKVETTTIPGLLVVEPAVHGDGRGFLMETY